MNKLVRNERLKARSTFYNGVAVASLGVGGLTQAATMIQAGTVSVPLSGFVVICAGIAFGLHSLALFILGGLEE